jgi:pimeloyl-ACP methyl ester carboxylesterase
MTTVVLVHGAYHGAWCWERLVPELTSRGLATLTPDLPCDDAGAGLAEYAEVVDAAVGDSDDLMLVGHSLGGSTIPLIAARRPVRQMVFLCSVPIPPGPPVVGQLPSLVWPAYLAAPRFHDEMGRELMANQSARELFFDDVDEPEALRAVARLRPQAQRPLIEPSPLRSWPDVPYRVILTADDRVVSVTAAQSWLGAHGALILPGSHSPFLSRPAALADMLVALAGSDAGPATGPATRGAAPS